MVSNAVWNLGGLDTAFYSTIEYYTSERGTIVYTGRPTTWTGQIGLMYPSDYGYATSGGGNTNRQICLSSNLYYWQNYNDCFSNNWLYVVGTYQWTITPDSSNSFYTRRLDINGGISNSESSYTYHKVSPVLYLSSNVKITSGTGFSSDPFILSL